jgi:hypothetical protein
MCGCGMRRGYKAIPHWPAYTTANRGMIMINTEWPARGTAVADQDRGRMNANTEEWVGQDAVASPAATEGGIAGWRGFETLNSNIPFPNPCRSRACCKSRLPFNLARRRIALSVTPGIAENGSNYQYSAVLW